MACALAGTMADPLKKLREKLCRELAQSEYDANVHCDREARRYGARPPGQAMRLIAVHARDMRAQLEPLWRDEQTAGMRAGQVVGEVFSAVRHFAVDWAIDAERSYRATLLGVQHGIGVAQLLHHVLRKQRDTVALRACDKLIDGRTRLLSRAEDRLDWFADHANIALRSSRRQIAKPSGPAIEIRPAKRRA
jgi:hypothetical protein